MPITSPPKKFAANGLNGYSEVEKLIQARDQQNLMHKSITETSTISLDIKKNASCQTGNFPDTMSHSQQNFKSSKSYKTHSSVKKKKSTAKSARVYSATAY
jgi:hypothetical protein